MAVGRARSGGSDIFDGCMSAAALLCGFPDRPPRLDGGGEPEGHQQ
jgi:hypothetical protein